MTTTGEKRYSTADWIAIGVLVALILSYGYFVLLPTIYNSSGGRRTRVLSNVKQIGLGIIMYASDSDEKYPFVHPFEFGVDPLDPYLKNKDLHENPFHPTAKKRLPNTTQHRFQYVLNSYCFLNAAPTRLVLGPIDKIEAPEKVINVTSQMTSSKEGVFVVAGFVDGHVRANKPEILRAAIPRGGDFPNPFRLDELIYTLSEDKSPPKFWAVSYEAVEMAAKAGGGQK